MSPDLLHAHGGQGAPPRASSPFFFVVLSEVHSSSVDHAKRLTDEEMRRDETSVAAGGKLVSYNALRCVCVSCSMISTVRAERLANEKPSVRKGV